MYLGIMLSQRSRYAKVAELVDALDLGSSSGDRVGVQISPFAPLRAYFLASPYELIKSADLILEHLIRKEYHADYC